MLKTFRRVQASSVENADFSTKFKVSVSHFSEYHLMVPHRRFIISSTGYILAVNFDYSTLVFNERPI